MNTPTQPEKKWVFTELVKEENDALGLIAYAHYKQDKHETAVSLRKEGMNEEEIKQKLEDFHHQVATIPQRQENYKQKALKTIADTVTVILSPQRNKLEKLEVGLNQQKLQLEQEKKEMDVFIKKQVKEKIEKAEKEIRKKELKRLDKASRAVVLPKGWVRFCCWLLSGIPGLIATIIISVLFFGCIAYFSSTEKKQNLLRGVIESTVMTISGVSQDLKAPLK